MKSQTTEKNSIPVSIDASGKPSGINQITLREKIEPILQKITDEEKKKAVSEFWFNHFAEYTGVLSSTDFLIEKGELTPEEAYEKINIHSNDIIEKAYIIEKKLNNKDISKILKTTFREILSNWIYKKSIIMESALNKKFGYRGDFQIINMMYSNKILSSGIGYCFDKYYLENLYTRATIGRKNKMKELLKEFINKSYSEMNILNIGSGPCKEINELFSENIFNNTNKITFHLVDHDIKALNYAVSNLTNCPRNIHFELINNSILDYVKAPAKYHQLLKGKDLIYSVGFLDYMSDKIVNNLIYFLYDLLKPGGKLILAHKDTKTYRPILADWFCDWNLYIRNKKDLINIINNSGIKNFSLSETKESITDVIFFIIIEKKSF